MKIFAEQGGECRQAAACQARQHSCAEFNAIDNCCFYLGSYIKQIDRQVEVACEDNPRAVRELQQPRCFVASVKAYRHCDDEDIEQNYPDERKEPPFEREEEDRPYQIDYELGVIYRLGLAVVQLINLEHREGYAHQGVQYRPRDGEEDRRGRERGLREVVIAHRAGGQQPDRRSQRQGYDYGYDIGFYSVAGRDDCHV